MASIIDNTGGADAGAEGEGGRRGRKKPAPRAQLIPYAPAGLPALTDGPGELGRSHEVAEVIGTPPAWIAKYGTVVLFVLVVLLTGFTLRYSWPNVVEGRLTLTRVDPPRRLQAQTDFTIEALVVSDRDTVEAGETLLAARSRANLGHIQYLEDRLLQVRNLATRELVDFKIDPSLNLGEIQPVVTSFQEKQEACRNLLARRLDGLTTAELERRIGERERYIREQRRQQARIEDRVVAARTRLEREKQLAEDGLANAAQLAEATIAFEATDAELQRNLSELRSASFDIEMMRNQIESYRGGLPGTIPRADRETREAFEALQIAVADWKRDFTVVSPVRGVVLFAPDLREGRFVFRESHLATVIPANAGKMIGRIDLPVRGSGKVEPGQRVLVRFDTYPYLEFGSVEGVVVTKGVLPENGRLSVEVAFPNELLTTTGNRLEPSPLMEGEARIVAGEERLLGRLLELE